MWVGHPGGCTWLGRFIRVLEHIKEEHWTLYEEKPRFGSFLDDDMTLDISICPLFKGAPPLCGPKCVF